jgi:hypothetical protein
MASQNVVNVGLCEVRDESDKGKWINVSSELDDLVENTKPKSNVDNVATHILGSFQVARTRTMHMCS